MLQKFQDLQIIEHLDETHGGSTQIFLGKYEKRLLVCKAIQKKSIQDNKSIEHVMNEKQALKYFTQKQSSGVNRLIHTFQDQEKLYMVLQPVLGLPLHKLLQMTGKFNPDFTRLIIIQVGFILKQFHENGFIYRDVKASNFMINQVGKVTIIDLGHAKRIDKDRTYTICGTTHSMPPEIYQNQGYSYQFDYYGYGILLYELLAGKAPFGYGNSNPNIVEQMKKGITEEKLSVIQQEAARDLIKRLLNDPSSRLGSKNGFQEILQHDYFNVPEFLDAKDILQGKGQIDSKDPKFEFYISEIIDFGLDESKYDEISPSDPFYKFFG